MPSLKAGTQYGDWQGTVAADEFGGSTDSFEHIFEATGKVDEDHEILAAFEFYAGEGYFFLQGYYHAKSQSPDIGGWVPTLNGDLLRSNEGLEFKTIKAEITQEQFFKYFKRFNVVLVRRGLDISGREYNPA